MQHTKVSEHVSRNRGRAPSIKISFVALIRNLMVGLLPPPRKQFSVVTVGVQRYFGNLVETAVRVSGSNWTKGLRVVIGFFENPKPKDK